MRLGLLRALVAGALLVSAAGCTDEPVAPSPSPFADCAALAAAPPGASSPGATPAQDAGPVPGAGGPAAGVLPDLSLSCFTGGAPVKLAALRGPALVNVWNTGCGPCRRELPALQRLADRTTGRLHVIGVVSVDPREAAGSFGQDLGLRFANLHDPEMRLQQALGRLLLPLTLLVDAQGRVVATYNGPELTDESLDRLVRDRLPGVMVP